jgi:hypothetical protein
MDEGGMTLTSAARFAALARPKKGRPLKPDAIRDASGIVRAEKPEAVTATGQEARVRRLLGIDTWTKARKDPKAMKKARAKVAAQYHGYQLGLLVLANDAEAGTGITLAQHDAGMDWLALHLDYLAVMGFPPPVRSPSAEPHIKRTGDATTSDERAARIAARYNTIKSKIWQQAVGHVGRHPWLVLQDVLIEDRYEPRHLGNLRLALNVLARA